MADEKLTDAHVEVMGKWADARAKRLEAEAQMALARAKETHADLERIRAGLVNRSAVNSLW